MNSSNEAGTTDFGCGNAVPCSAAYMAALSVQRATASGAATRTRAPRSVNVARERATGPTSADDCTRSTSGRSRVTKAASAGT